MEGIYIDIYQANSDIFRIMPILPVGDSVIIRPIIVDQLEVEADSYLDVSNDNLIKQFLQEVYVVNLSQAKEKLESYIQRYLSYASIPFVIALKDTKIPLGYIICHSPLCTYHNSTERMNEWSIDFWLRKEVRGKNLMTSALNTMLQYLQKMEIPHISAYTLKNNFKCIEVLKKNNFANTGETPDNKMYRFNVWLNRQAE